MGSSMHSINLLHNNGTSPKLRPSRECQLKRAGSRASDVKVPVTAHGKARMPGPASSSHTQSKRKRKPTKVDDKKLATAHIQKAMQKTVVSLSTTSSRSLLDDCKKLAYDFREKKNYDFKELFVLPKEGDFSQRELNVGFVDALLCNVKKHEDAD